MSQSPYAQAAPDLIALGYHPLPIIPLQKRPGEFRSGAWQGMSDWQRFRDRTPSDFERGLWARNYPDANIGIVLGSPAGHHPTTGELLHVIAVDIDVDDPDDFQTIRGQTPHTPMSKRGQKGETRFYRAAASIKSHPYNRATDRRRLVDLLTGFDTRQTVIPPSIHPDTGRAYAWLGLPVAADHLPVFDDDDLEVLQEALSSCGWNLELEAQLHQVKAPRAVPSSPDPDDFWTEVKTAALASLDAWVPALGLYDLRKARGGYEAVAHWRASSTGRQLEVRKRNLSIQANGITDFGDGPRGYSAIDLVMVAKGVEQAAATAWLRHQLGLADDHVVIQLQPREAAAPEPEPTEPPPVVGELPDALTRVPGLLGELTNWIADSGRRPQRGLALGAALAVIGTAAGRRYATPTNSGTHLYILGLARSSAGKDHALRQIARLLNSAGMKAHIGPSQFMSLSAVAKRLMRQPLTLCAMDEFGSFLARINNRKAQAHEKAISGVLREAWSCSFDTMPMPEWAGHETDPVHSPALSIYGVSVPDEFYDSLSGADVSNGFLNRFLLISTRKKPAEREPKLDRAVVPEPIRAGLHRIYGSGSALAAATMHNQQADAPLFTATWDTPEAARIYADFGKVIEAREEQSAFLGRTVEMSVRLATIRAIGVSPSAPRITVEDMEWGRDLALWSGDRMIGEASDYLADTQNQADTQRVLRVLKDRGRMKHGDLVRAMQHRLKARDLKDLISGLADAGQVLIEAAPTPGGGPEQRWYSPKG